ncbi:alpha/beta hydrolase [Aspergillus stella-maris]|uniref:alpha/beta hydrolase n=1 Tax=Aspergillus stella-maris TaxID=1810926 RepID=UPI003CCDFAC4
MATPPPPQIHQPIHPSIHPLLDPEYVSFHNTHFQYIIPDDQKPWDGSARTSTQPWPRTSSPLTPVSSIRDIELPNFPVRVFTPNHPRPKDGYPVFIWFHGGGWAIGGLNDGNDLCTLIADVAKCVVITVGYRLAPEDPYPAAVEDAIAALEWVTSPPGSSVLGGIDKSRIAIGGTSAGGNLAAVLAMKASLLSTPIQIVFQLLVVPVIDNTATIEGIWKENQHAPWLTPARMTWYRDMYIPNPETRFEWQASPNLAPVELLANSPDTFIAVSGQDLLAPEARSYAGVLEQAWKGEGVEGRNVEVKVYEGGTHSILAMSGVLSQGKLLLRDCAERVSRAFSN